MINNSTDNTAIACSDSAAAPFYLVLLHDRIVDKHGKLVTTSLTMIDVHDIARSSRTFGVKKAFIAHPAPALRKLARTLKPHWEEGYGATYNPNRKDALHIIDIAADLEEVMLKIELECGSLPKLIATSAKEGRTRISFAALRDLIACPATGPLLLLLGTGWGLSDELLERADYFLEPIRGAADFNHLSVRSACAIMLDRLLGK